jgi:ABC-type sulfate transport system permease component
MSSSLQLQKEALLDLVSQLTQLLLTLFLLYLDSKGRWGGGFGSELRTDLFGQKIGVVRAQKILSFPCSFLF